VVYLVIMFAVAAAGITRLWLQQRKERAHLETVDGFRESLESISSEPRGRSEAPAGCAPTLPLPRRSVTLHLLGVPPSRDTSPWNPSAGQRPSAGSMHVARRALAPSFKEHN